MGRVDTCICVRLQRFPQRPFTSAQTICATQQAGKMQLKGGVCAHVNTSSSDKQCQPNANNALHYYCECLDKHAWRGSHNPMSDFIFGKLRADLPCRWRRDHRTCARYTSWHWPGSCQREQPGHGQKARDQALGMKLTSTSVLIMRQFLSKTMCASLPKQS